MGRYRQQTGTTASGRFSLGWAFHLPAALDEAEDVITVRQYAQKSSRTADGWEGTWADAETHRTRESYRNMSLDAVLAWAKSTQVAQVLVEDIDTRELRLLE
jgi:hypothetical protein